MIDRSAINKTIEQLEERSYGDPKTAATPMVKRCLELCKIPLHNFTIGDLRLMIGQEFSLAYLIPMALVHLRQDLFVEGDYYPGDLLNAVVTVDSEFWVKNRLLWDELNLLFASGRDEMTTRKIDMTLFDTAL